MCLAVPGQVVERLAESGGLEFATVDFGGLRRRVCVSCVPEAALGDYVIVHAGIAISRIDAGEAQRILEALEQIGELNAELGEAERETPR